MMYEELDINKPEARIMQEDNIDGFVFICPRCNLYGPTVNHKNRCVKCGQLINLEDSKFVKEKRRIKYLTEKQFKDYWEEMINNE